MAPSLQRRWRDVLEALGYQPRADRTLLHGFKEASEGLDLWTSVVTLDASAHREAGIVTALFSALVHNPAGLRFDVVEEMSAAGVQRAQVEGEREEEVGIAAAFDNRFFIQTNGLSRFRLLLRDPEILALESSPAELRMSFLDSSVRPMGLREGGANAALPAGLSELRLEAQGYSDTLDWVVVCGHAFDALATQLALERGEADTDAPLDRLRTTPAIRIATDIVWWDGPRIRGRALRALRHRSDAPALRALVEILGDEDAQLASDAADILVTRDLSALLPELVSHLGDVWIHGHSPDTDPLRRVLYEVGAGAAVDLVDQTLSNEPGSVDLPDALVEPVVAAFMRVVEHDRKDSHAALAGRALAEMRAVGAESVMWQRAEQMFDPVAIKMMNAALRTFEAYRSLPAPAEAPAPTEQLPRPAEEAAAASDRLPRRAHDPDDDPSE